jgi:4-hydroxy-tetrahydrodipicolinate reductase
MIQVTVHGAEGRMGRLVTRLIQEAADCELTALVTEPGRGQPTGDFHPTLPLTGQDRLSEIHPPDGVIVDFSLASALEGLLKGATATGARLVIGTTGYTPIQLEELASFSHHRPVVWATNFSVGIPTLQLALEQLAKTLPPDFSAEEVEMHHHRKQDKPSGTARTLASAWQQARGGDPVPIHSVRLGGIIGEHVWTISDEEETLILTHRAHSRRAFLRGVLPAVRFVSQQEKGLFDLTHVLASQASQSG